MWLTLLCDSVTVVGMDTAGWTLGELTERVGSALAAATRLGTYPGPPNGRVRDVPDRRAIRWYTTIGLVDRPLELRGRTAIYGQRHLRQLVAIKRRQAEGRSLAEIQAELAGAGDAAVAAVANLPEPLPEPLVSESPPRRRPELVFPEPRRGPEADARFWASGIRARDGAGDSDGAGKPDGAGGVPDADSVTTGRPELLAAVVLADGVTLLLPAVPNKEDLDAIAGAARGLLDVLVTRGLIEPERRRSLR